tara:strand:- start:484 stop:750 length:267 start_codon:yes stop_codon:yes gene_type:complete
MRLRRRNKKEETQEPMVNPLIATGAKLMSFIIPKMFKDKNGKWSSKRTIGGVIAIAAVHQTEVAGEVTWQHLVMFALAAATVYAPDSK